MKRLLKRFSHTDVTTGSSVRACRSSRRATSVCSRHRRIRKASSHVSHALLCASVCDSVAVIATDISRNADSTLHLTFANGFESDFHRVAVTTGGAPKGEGLCVHASLGHDIEQPVPSLFTFNVPDARFLELMGTVVEPVIASIPGTKHRAEGALLVTHWGMSGPAVLKLSSHAARFLHENAYRTKVAVNWTGMTQSSVAAEAVAAIAAANAQKQLASVRPLNLPARLWLYILAKLGLSQQKRWGELGKKDTNRLVETLTNDIYEINGKGRFRDEFVTCGGVSLASVDMNTRSRAGSVRTSSLLAKCLMSMPLRAASICRQHGVWGM